jgi:hypothetical protein
MDFPAMSLRDAIEAFTAAAYVASDSHSNMPDFFCRRSEIQVRLKASDFSPASKSAPMTKVGGLSRLA